MPDETFVEQEVQHVADAPADTTQPGDKPSDIVDFFDGKSHGENLSTKLWMKIRAAQVAGRSTVEVDTARREHEVAEQQRTIRDAVDSALSPMAPDYSQYAPDEQVELRAQQIVAEREMEELVESHYERVAETKNAYSDFAEVLADYADMPVHPAIREAVITLKNGPEALYEAAKSGEIKRILGGRITPVQAVTELGRISARLEREADDDGDYELSHRSAPKPPTPVRKTGAVSSRSINDPSLPFEDFVTLRNQQIKNRQKNR